MDPKTEEAIERQMVEMSRESSAARDGGDYFAQTVKRWMKALSLPELQSAREYMLNSVATQHMIYGRSPWRIFVDLLVDDGDPHTLLTLKTLASTHSERGPEWSRWILRALSRASRTSAP